MANPFLKPFLDEDLVVRTRVRNLFWILTAFIVAMVAMGTLTLLDGGFQTTALTYSVALLFGVALELLRRGQYRAAANLAFAVLVIAGIAGSLINRIGDSEDDFFRMTAVFSMTLVLTTFYGYHWLMGVIMGGAGILTLVIILLTPASPEILAKTLGDVQKAGTPAAVAFIFLLTATVATLGLFQTGRILHRNARSQKITEDGFEDVRKVVAAADAGIEVSRHMEQASVDLGAGARSIREELKILDAQTSNLLDQAREAGDTSSVLENIQVSLRDKMEVQVRSIHQTSSALEQIDALFQTIATSSRSKKESLDVLGTQAREGERRLQQMAGAFAAMQKTAEDVLSVVQVIEDISNRTNLLAMNASIEAAHAGNAGRGFAVVASEIRKLAEETGQNSQAIRQTLDANLAQVQTAVQASHESQTLLATMIRAFQDIETLLEEQMNGMEEMGKGTQDILHSVGDLQLGTRTVQEAAQQLEGAVKTNRHQASSVRDTTAVLTEGVQTLQKVAVSISQTAETIGDFGRRNHELVQGQRTSLERVQDEMSKRKQSLD